MSDDRITVEELRYISVFQEITGATVYRCIVDESNNKLYVLVARGDLGRAIGKRGYNIKILRSLLKKDIEVIEYSESIDGMVKNLFPGAKILGVRVTNRGEERIVNLKVAEEDKGRVIGKDGRNIKKARLILGKLFGINKVYVR